MLDIGKKQGVIASISSEAARSKLPQVLNDIDNQSKKIATCELNHGILDGSYFFPTGQEKEVGAITAKTSDKECITEEVLTFSVPTRAATGFVLFFDSQTNDYPRDFDCDCYLNSNHIAHYEKRGLVHARGIVAEAVPEYDKVVFNFLRTAAPVRKVKIAKVYFSKNPYSPYADARWVDMKTQMDVSPAGVKNNVTITMSSESLISDKKQTVNGIDDPSRKIATCEMNQAILDGSYQFPTGTDGEVGARTLNTSNNGCIMNERIEFKLPKTFESAGFTLFFDTKTNDFPETILVEAFLSGSLVSTDQIIKNRSSKAVSLKAVDTYNAVRFTFLKTAAPKRKIKLTEVYFGVVETFDIDNTTGSSLLQEVDITGDTLPMAELTVKFDNLSKRYNLLSKSGLHRYLKDGQLLKTYVGIGQFRADREYLKVATTRYTSSKTEEGGLLAEVMANDALSLLDKKTWSSGRVETVTLSATVKEIVGTSLEYKIDAGIASRSISAAIPRMTARNALQLVVQAARCFARINEEGTLVISDGKFTESVQSFNRDMIYDEVGVSDEMAPDAIDVVASRWVLLSKTKVENVTDAEVEVSGRQRFFINHDPVNSKNVTVTGATRNSFQAGPTLGTWVTITGNGTAKIAIVGKKYELKEYVYRASKTQILEDGEVEQIENAALLYSNGSVFTDWHFSMLQKDTMLDIPDRGNPALEICDTVTVRDFYGGDRQTSIRKRELKFDGALSADIEGVFEDAN